MDLNVDMLNELEYVQNRPPIQKSLDDEAENTISTKNNEKITGNKNTSSNDNSSENSWIHTLKKQTLQNDTYLTLINDSRSIMIEGSQAWFRYGKLTNLKLLIHYGFCLKDNVYDSIKW